MIKLDLKAKKSIYEQIVDGFKEEIVTGKLSPGDQLPSVRDLSARLTVNPNTIQKAYTDLIAGGILVAVPGKGCFVSPQAPALLRERKRGELEMLAHKIAEWKQAGVTLEEIEQCVRDAYHAPLYKEEDTI